MNRKFIFLMLFAIPLICVAQRQLVLSYDYDASGNRVLCKTINIIPRDSLPEELPSPPAPPENQPLTSTSTSLTPNLTPQSAEYFVETIAQTEIKIYPNPTTEKITLEFSGDVRVENFRPLQLFSLSGQLLQEHPVHSPTTTVSLAGLPKGVYILKVSVNGVTEEWRVIKN